MKRKKNFKLFKSLSLSVFKNYKKSRTENKVIYGILAGSLIFTLVYFAINYKIFSILTWDIGFIDPSSAFAESLIKLYNYIWFYLIFVLLMVIVLLARVIYLFTWKANFFNFSYIKEILLFLLKQVLRMRHFFIARSKMFRSFVVLNELKANKIKLNLWYSNDKRYYDLNWRKEMKLKEKFLRVNDIREYKRLENVWCAVPTFILLSIANPSIAFIHTIDPAIDPIYTIKIIGRQWYWNYSFEGYIFVDDIKSDKYKLTEEYRNFSDYMKKVNDVRYYFSLDKEFQEFWNRIPHMKRAIHVTYNFDSILKGEEELVNGTHRLLEVDNRLVLPLGVPIRFVITSVDVIHSWAVPTLGLKVDAVPGRLNQFIAEINKPGVYFGQCSELCGPLHGFMPIVIVVIPAVEFENWLLSVGQISDYK